MKRSSLFVGVVLVMLVAVAGLFSEAIGVVAQGDGGEDVEYTWAGDVEAPDFPSGVDWINVSAPLTMADLRGKIVLLDFWTYGCINCIHIIPDLKRLEAEYPNELVVVGVHSAKFDNESRTENIRRIVQRYEVEHPVLNDNEFILWQQYGVSAWPTVVVIDPFGKVVGALSGEPLYERIAPIIQTMAQEYGEHDALNLAPLAQWQPESASVEDTLLRFPGKVLADPEGNRLFISDSNNNRIVIAALDTYEILDVIGTGEEGLVDGDFATAQFFRPQGLTLVENVLFVTDTENHAIRAINLEDRTVTRVAGTGKQGFNREESGPGPETELNSPWDLVAHEGKIYIAMAGQHQLWVYDITSGEVGPYAGSGREALEDGRLLAAGMNQPSGTDTDGTLLYFADPEASAIRTADLDPEGEVKTIVGTGLFDFGDVDGTGDGVRLQHPLGLTVADDGYLYVADTYNNKIKRIDPAKHESVTFLGTGEAGFADGLSPMFYEPGGIDYANGKLYIADTNNHAIRVAEIATGEVSTVTFPNPERLATSAEATLEDIFSEEALRGDNVVTLPPQTVASGSGEILVDVTIPEGYKLNELAPFTAIWSDDAVAQIPAESREIRIIKPDLPLTVPVTFNEGQTDLKLALTVYWCEAISETLCFVERVELVAPLTVVSDGDTHTIQFEHTLVPPTNNNSF